MQSVTIVTLCIILFIDFSTIHVEHISKVLFGFWHRMPLALCITTLMLVISLIYSFPIFRVH